MVYEKCAYTAVNFSDVGKMGTVALFINNIVCEHFLYTVLQNVFILSDSLVGVEEENINDLVKSLFDSSIIPLGDKFKVLEIIKSNYDNFSNKK